MPRNLAFSGGQPFGGGLSLGQRLLRLRRRALLPSLCIFRCAKNAQQTLRTEKPPSLLGGCVFWRFRAKREMQLPLGQLQAKNAMLSGVARELTHPLFPVSSRESCACRRLRLVSERRFEVI